MSTRGLPARLVKDVLFHEPGRGYFTIKAGTECRILHLSDVPAHRRGALRNTLKSHDGRDYVAVLLDGRARVVGREDVENLSEPRPGPAHGRPS